MGVGRIEHINNNNDSAETWYKSMNSGNNCALSGGKAYNESHFSLSDKDFHPLSAKTNYVATSCGISRRKRHETASYSLPDDIQEPNRWAWFTHSHISRTVWPQLYHDSTTSKTIPQMSVASDFTPATWCSNRTDQPSSATRNLQILWRSVLVSTDSRPSEKVKNSLLFSPHIMSKSNRGLSALHPQN